MYFLLYDLDNDAFNYKAQAESLQCESKYEEALPFYDALNDDQRRKYVYMFDLKRAGLALS